MLYTYYLMPCLWRVGDTTTVVGRAIIWRAKHDFRQLMIMRHGVFVLPFHADWHFHVRGTVMIDGDDAREIIR